MSAKATNIVQKTQIKRPCSHTEQMRHRCMVSREEEEAMDKMKCRDTDEADGTRNCDQIKRTLKKYAAQTERMKELKQTNQKKRTLLKVFNLKTKLL